MKKKGTKEDISQSLDQLEKIVQWFQEQDELDIQRGLEKIRQGAALVKELRGRLKAVENEFVEIQKELAADEENS